MKKITVILILLTTFAIASDNPFVMLFTGRWQLSENPLLIDEGGFQDIQNLRKTGKRFKGVSGHAPISVAGVPGGSAKLRNGFHFKKDQPSESHVIIYAQDSIGSGSKLYQNETAVPEIGAWNTSILHTNSGTTIGRFANAPRGNMVYCNGAETMIWGGDALEIRAFITSVAEIVASAPSNPRDYTQAVNNTNSSAGQIAKVGVTTGAWALIGSTRPLESFNITVSSGAAGAPTMTGKYWNGSWTALSTFVDGTSGLTTSGEVTFDSTVADAKTKYINGYILYWYQITVDAGDSEISNVTVGAPFQDMKNIWDGTENAISSCLVYDGTTYEDYTTEAQDDSSVYVVVLDALADSLFLGFTTPQQGLSIRFLAGKENVDAATLTVSYNNGTTWAATSNLQDGTLEGTDSFAKSGVIHFDPVAEGLEFPTEIGNEVPLYYYKLTFSAALSASVEAYYITGIPAPEPILGYTFPDMYQNRTFLFNATEGDKNTARYSVFDNPDMYNGPDSGVIFFGDDKEVTASAVFYNVFLNQSQELMIATKAHETWRVFGDSPETWRVQKMSGNIGCVAPLSMAVCEIGDIGPETKRNLAVWQSDAGVVISDGATINYISNDISQYWDESSDLAIPADRINASFGWYDSNLNVYKLLISSGAGQATHNIELEYSFTYNEWTKIFREEGIAANPLQCGFMARDTDGNAYSYGGTDLGDVYRLNYGTDWDGTPITQYIHTKDLLLDSEQPFFRHTQARFFRVAFKKKTGGTELTYLLAEDGERILTEHGDEIIVNPGESITIEHYCENEQTVNGVDGQRLPTSLELKDGPFRTQDIKLGYCLIHSFKLIGNIETLVDGMEIVSMGVTYDPQKQIETD